MNGVPVADFFRTHVSARLATIWLVVAVPASLASAATFAAWYSARLSLVVQERQGYAENTGKSFELLLLKMRLAMRAAGPAAAEPSASPAAHEAALASLAAPYPVAYAAFTDPAGRVLAASRPGLAGASFARDAAFRAAVRAPDGSGMEPSEAASGGVVGFHVVQVIPGRPGRPEGVAVMLVDVRLLARTFQSRVPTGGVSVVDSAGQVVYQSEDPRLAARRARWGAEFPFVRRAMDGHVSTVRDWRFPLGGTRIGVFVPIDAYGWAAGSSVSPQAALAPFYLARAIGVPVLLIVAALSLLTGMRIARGIRLSLVGLADEARRVGSGDLDAPVTAVRADEIGQVANALEAARIELRDARRRTEDLLAVERERARFGHSMVEINADLASSLDVDESLPGVLADMLEELEAHWAAVTERVEGGWRVRHVAGAVAGAMRAGAVFPDREAPTLMRLLRTREPHVVADTRTAPDVNREMSERIGSRAYATYPLIARGELTGGLTVGFDEPHAPSAEELDYLRRVAFAVSLAEENSRLYQAEHRVAETLQTALLALPEHIPGIEFAHMYHSATETARVGGDFYDLFELEHEKVGVTVGDISGHGIDAAVLTSLVKNAIRVQATQQDRRPAEVMASASSILYQNSAPETFATVFFGVLDLATGRLDYCSAGHPTAACVRHAGGVVGLPANSPLVGAFTDEVFETTTAHIGARDVLFLYTDGLTEARRDRELYGEERLFALLGRERGGAPHRLLAVAVDDVLAFASGRLSDDLAILVLRPAED